MITIHTANQIIKNYYRDTENIYQIIEESKERSVVGNFIPQVNR